MKKRKPEAIFIPNQFAKSPSGWFASNLEQEKIKKEERQRRLKHHLKTVR